MATVSITKRVPVFGAIWDKVLVRHVKSCFDIESDKGTEIICAFFNIDDTRELIEENSSYYFLRDNDPMLTIDEFDEFVRRLKPYEKICLVELPVAVRIILNCSPKGLADLPSYLFPERVRRINMSLLHASGFEQAEINAIDRSGAIFKLLPQLKLKLDELDSPFDENIYLESVIAVDFPEFPETRIRNLQHTTIDKQIQYSVAANFAFMHQYGDPSATLYLQKKGWI